MSLDAVVYVAGRLDDPDLELSTLARCMALAIADRINAHTRVTYTGDWIAQRCGVKPASLRRPLGQLVDAGMFHVKHRPGRASVIALPPAESCPQPRAAQRGVDAGDYPQPRAEERGPRAVQRGPRAAQRGVPGIYQDQIPAAAHGAPPADLDELLELARAGARLEVARVRREGHQVRNVAAYEETVAARLVEDDLDRIRTALASSSSTHERAEWLIGARRQLPAS